MDNKKIILGVGICLVVAALSFYGGVSYGKSRVDTKSFGNRQGFTQGGFNQNGSGKMVGQNSRMMGGGFTSGEIISKDDKSITIKLRDGGSKIVLVPQTVKVEKTVDGAASDVLVGKSVMVTGTTNPDGSVSASSVQIRPDSQMPEPGKLN